MLDVERTLATHGTECELVFVEAHAALPRPLAPANRSISGRLVIQAGKIVRKAGDLRANRTSVRSLRWL
ncbi:hypothetical protein [Amycolatopsis tolypomycina]|uniref:hypothetical protein n=1 Tax=Amycolatopsis tolypomycina TaxID=208445 RepID=UPI00115F7823|nr:hypothetical protein [Amycolatopsis tolypomycina]